MSGARILAVDDEPHVLSLCRDVLAEAGYQVDTAVAVAPALERIRSTQFDLVLTDLRMPERGGLEFIQAAHGVAPRLPFIVFTAYPSIESAIDAIRHGAEDFLPKPFNNDHLCHVVGRVLERQRLESENQLLRTRLAGEAADGRILGQSLPMLKLLDLVARAAPTESSVLVLGESGAGKELVARRLHDLSPRRRQPFVPLDCAALPESLLESELFGYEKGAFTGAAGRRHGLIESAAGGTLFLDEIGDLSVALQAKLLRVLEERQLRRVGGQEFIAVDIRLIAATNVDLSAAIRAGRFREDLYFRLNVIPVTVPPLRQRSEDIPGLVEAFLHEFSARRPDPPAKVEAEALEVLCTYPWPGNVRELRNVVERMVSLAAGPVLGLADVPPEIAGVTDAPTERRGSLTFRQSKRRFVGRFERDYLHRVLVAEGGNVTRAACTAGMNRSALQRLMRKHGLNSGAYRRPSLPLH